MAQLYILRKTVKSRLAAWYPLLVGESFFAFASFVYSATQALNFMAGFMDRGGKTYQGAIVITSSSMVWLLPNLITPAFTQR